MNNKGNNQLSIIEKLLLGIQHTLAMFGATILVPILTGLNPSVALFTAGLGTLLFHFITKRKVPVFLGSSFAFIGAIQLVSKNYGSEYAMGGAIFAGFMYVLFAGLVYLIGAEKFKSFFPPIVIGPIIVVIGLGLSPVAINMAKENWIISLSVVATIVIVSIFSKGFVKLLPILLGIVVGYVVSILLGAVDFNLFKETTLISIPPFSLPKFNLSAILSIAPIAFVVVLEHLGDINANGAVVGKNFVDNPGLHRTILGDGLATILAGILGGPPNTTYSENTGVLATTKVYDPSILRIAATISIVVSFIGFFGVFLQTIPSAVLGGASMVLFGMIATIGFRTISENQIDFTNNKNMLIMSVILVIGLGGMTFNVLGVQFSSLSISAIVGIILNQILPNKA